MPSPLLSMLLASELETAHLVAPAEQPFLFAVDQSTWVQLELYAAEIACAAETASPGQPREN